MKFLLGHAVRTTYMLQFLKCTSDKCSHCTLNLVVATAAVDFLRAHGERLMTPRPSARHEGHYCTYTEVAVWKTSRLQNLVWILVCHLCVIETAQSMFVKRVGNMFYKSVWAVKRNV